MKKILFSSFAVFALVSSINATEYALDKSHSSVNFKIKHMSVSTTNGNFKNFEAVLDFDGAKINKLEAIIKVDSINTDNETRDNHLKAADFFDSAKFPEMKFVMKEQKDDKIIGNLTLKDVTKSVELDYEFGGSNIDQKGKEHIGFSLEGKIKRSDFNFAPNSSTMTLGDDVKISVDVEAIKQ